MCRIFRGRIISETYSGFVMQILDVEYPACPQAFDWTYMLVAKSRRRTEQNYSQKNKCSRTTQMGELPFIVLVVSVPIVQAAIPGTFFWKPRLGLDLSVPTTEISLTAARPNKENVAKGLAVLVDGYAIGISIIALASGISSAATYPHLNPISAYFYTNTYRWGLRYLSLIPLWLSGRGGNYVETHKVWRRRFYYMDEFMPNWMKTLMPFVKESEWKQEEKDFRRFKKYAEPAFGKHFRYPSKIFNNFKSEITEETDENLDGGISSMSE